MAKAEALNAKINSFEGTAPSPAVRVASTKAKVAKAAKPIKRKKRAKKGDLKAAILGAIRATGKKGATVREISTTVKTKPANVYASLHYALKSKVAGLTKSAKGKYFYAPAVVVAKVGK